MYKCVVVGTDGSETARKAVAEAVALAAQDEAELHVVSAFRPVNASAPAGSGAETWVIHPRSAVDNILEEAAAAARIQGVKAETYAERKDPADAVISVAKQVKADLVVVGNKGIKGPKAFILGSIPNKIAHDAPCAVLIVKTT